MFRSQRERLERKSKKKKKGAEDELDDMLQVTLQTVTKPKLTDLLPFCIGRSFLATIRAIPSLFSSVKEHFNKKVEPEVEDYESEEEEGIAISTVHSQLVSIYVHEKLFSHSIE